MNSKTKKEPGKIAMAFGYLVVFGIIALVIWGAVALFSGHKSPAKASTVSKTIAKTTTKPAATTTASLATLNADAVADFNPVITDLSGQMTKGQSYATQSDAINASSSFHTWEQAEQDSQNVTNNKEVTTAYNKAANAYYDAHQTAPAAIDSWDTDMGAVVSDITQWSDAEWLLFGQQASGSVTSDQQQAVKTALQQYQSDLAKAQADVAQL